MTDETPSLDAIYDAIASYMHGDMTFHAYVACNMGSHETMHDAEDDCIEWLCQRVQEEIVTIDEALPTAIRIVADASYEPPE